MWQICIEIFGRVIKGKIFDTEKEVVEAMTEMEMVLESNNIDAPVYCIKLFNKGE